MTGMRLQLESFATGKYGPATATAIDVGDEARLASFDQGYTAGWDDALAAQDAETARMREELARTVADLGFTYREAHRHVLMALKPLLVDMVGKVLPSIARAALSEIVLELVMPVAGKAADRPMELVAHPSVIPVIEPVLAAQSVLPLGILPDEGLTPGQIRIRAAEGEQMVDLDGVVAAIGLAVSTFFEAAGEADRKRASG